jgi:hypothetical protein
VAESWFVSIPSVASEKRVSASLPASVILLSLYVLSARERSECAILKLPHLRRYLTGSILYFDT